MSKRSDKQLIEDYEAGDKAALSELIGRHRKRVADYINIIVRDSDLADDLTQETFISVVRVLDQGNYVDNGKFLSWVLRIAHNRVIDHFRKCRQVSHVTESDAGYDILSTTLFECNTVEDDMVCHQTRSDVRRLIEFLPPEQQEVVRMRYFEGMSFREIAERADTSINTALGRMRYALINLRKLIREHNMVLH